jgi:hypothetical protein
MNATPFLDPAQRLVRSGILLLALFGGVFVAAGTALCGHIAPAMLTRRL